MRSTHQSRLAGVMFVLGALPSACAHETQAEMVALSELETAGTSGATMTGAGGSGVFGIERATAYGVSIFEVEIYGDTNEACEAQ
jgi:hypothetical protein